MATRTLAYLRQHHLALICLFLIATGGTAYAAGKIGAKQIKTGAVQSKHVRDGSLLAADFAQGQLASGSQGSPGAAGQQGSPGATGESGAPGEPGEDAFAPAGAIGFFNLASCPSGWTEFSQARGRYLVGLPSPGTLGGTRGTPLTSLENRTIGQHGHGVTDPGHDHFSTFPAGVNDASAPTTTLDRATASASETGHRTGTAFTQITIDDAGSVPGTNAPYIQLLVCQKA